MSGRTLRIAWLGPGPSEGGGVGGVATELLDGLAGLGARIDCFLPGKPRPLPVRLTESVNITFVWGTTTWHWDRWYSSTKVTAFASGLLARGLGLLRLRREIASRHRIEPYDLIFQFSTIESLAVPRALARAVPLVIQPETHAAGELRALIAERRLSWRVQSPFAFAIVAAILLARSNLQRIKIRRADLVVCISGVFRDHLVNDYGLRREQTMVIPNPVRVERFSAAGRPVGEPPTVLVLGRIAVRKGIEDVIELARALLREGSGVRIRVVGGPSLWSDYTRLLDDLPAENAHYAGPLDAAEIPAELSASDLLLQPSHYEPFALTVGEALAAGLPVVATSEVGAIESVERTVVAEVAPGDVPAMSAAIDEMLDRLRAEPERMRSVARSEAERLFAPEVVSRALFDCLQSVVGSAAQGAPGAIAEEAPAGPA
jgi:glycosyltransferase involved in cell wall biosynthesis